MLFLTLSLFFLRQKGSFFCCGSRSFRSWQAGSSRWSYWVPPVSRWQWFKWSNITFLRWRAGRGSLLCVIPPASPHCRGSCPDRVTGTAFPLRSCRAPEPCPAVVVTQSVGSCRTMEWIQVSGMCREISVEDEPLDFFADGFPQHCWSRLLGMPRVCWSSWSSLHRLCKSLCHELCFKPRGSFLKEHSACVKKCTCRHFRILILPTDARKIVFLQHCLFGRTWLLHQTAQEDLGGEDDCSELPQPSPSPCYARVFLVVLVHGLYTWLPGIYT